MKDLNQEEEGKSNSETDITFVESENAELSVLVSRWKNYLTIKETKPCLQQLITRSDQATIKEDCCKLVEKLGINEIDKLSVTSDLESILTTLAEEHNIKYCKDNGWLEILKSLLALKAPRDETYAMFEAITKRYIPQCFLYEHNLEEIKQTINDQPFHLLRLLLFYHDPELGSFLDTKKINPDSYALSWFRSLFAAHCDIKVLLALWDVYLQKKNPFLIFFLALVMLVNAKEQVMSLKDQSQEAIVEALNSVPSALDFDDVADLFYLVESHYISQTPSCINELHNLVFYSDNDSQKSLDITDLAQALCLPVSFAQLLPTSDQSGVRFFIVDCRPADQYNNGHLATAFHLDCSLMLQEPSAFNTAVQAILAAQKQAILAGSRAGGKHLCFLGSGRDEEDQYVHMVVASFLQKHHLFVSLAYGGYATLHNCVAKINGFEKFFIDHNKKHCLCCKNPHSFLNPAPLGFRNLSSSTSSISGSQVSASDNEHSTTSIFDRMTSVVKSKAIGVKEKLVDIIINPHASDERHVNCGDLGKRYRGSSVFSLFDVDYADEVLNSDELEIKVEEWCKDQQSLGCFHCEELTDDGKRYPSYLVLTKTHLHIIRVSSSNKDYGKVVTKRPLEMIVQITSKRRLPNFITIKYGQTIGDADCRPNIMACDKLNISDPFPFTRLIKQLVFTLLNGEAEKESFENEREDPNR